MPPRSPLIHNKCSIMWCSSENTAQIKLVVLCKYICSRSVKVSFGSISYINCFFWGPTEWSTADICSGLTGSTNLWRFLKIGENWKATWYKIWPRSRDHTWMERQYFTSMSFVNAVMISQPTLSNAPAAENKKPLCNCKYGQECRVKCSHTFLQFISRQMLVCCVVSLLAPV